MEFLDRLLDEMEEPVFKKKRGRKKKKRPPTKVHLSKHLNGPRKNVFLWKNH